MIHLTRRYRFAASHRLHVPSLSDDENRRLFDKCNNPYGHGHDYTLEITARGEVDERTGLLLDQPTLDRLVEDTVLRDVRMKYLNEQVPAFREMVPTTENLVGEIRRRLLGGWKDAFGDGGPELERVRIVETRKNVFETAGA